MITLYGFGRIFPEGIGETKNLRAHWALEETGLPYRVHAPDHTAGELDSDAYAKLSPFRQAPVIDDGGFVVAESAAVVLYVAEKAGKLLPSDAQGRTRVVQWCFAAVSSAGLHRPHRDFRPRQGRPKAAHGGAQARPAWQRTLGLYADRLGVSVDQIR